MAEVSPIFAQLAPGDPMPRFKQRCQGIQFAPDSMAGRYLVFCFFGSAAHPESDAELRLLQHYRDRFDDARVSFFGVSTDPEDEASTRVSDLMPGIRFMWDMDGSVSRLFGALSLNSSSDAAAVAERHFWMIVDPSLHILRSFSFSGDNHNENGLFEFLDRLPHPSRFAGFEIPAPVLVLPNIFDTQLCRRLISLYDENGGGESGVMRGNVGVFDRSFKSRKDFTIEDQDLVRTIQSVVKRRVLPEIEKLFFMKVTRMERYIVGCYSAEDGGHFRPHRDNASEITAHRRFALSINLNDDFDGGEVSFPEFNSRGIKAPPGWALLFPCAALHAVSRITRGQRYAFLPFLYDETGAKLRQDIVMRRANPFIEANAS